MAELEETGGAGALGSAVEPGAADAGPDGRRWARGEDGAARMNQGRDPGDPRRWYGAEVEDEIVRRVAAGETLHAVCQHAHLPRYQVVLEWTRRRVGFGARLEAARREAGRPFRAPWTPYCEATFEIILQRLCDGESMLAICRDPHMPDTTTVYRWIRAREDLREQVALAREIQGDRLADLGLETALETTPATARAAEVKLRHLRWHAARLNPVNWAARRAAAAPATPEPAPPPRVDRVVLKTFWLETRPEDGWQRVRTTTIDPETREPVEVEATEGEWRPPPQGAQTWLDSTELSARRRAEQGGRPDEWRRWLPAQGRGRGGGGGEG